MTRFNANPASTNGDPRFSGILWVYPGLVLASPREGGVLRYAAGFRRPDGWIWPLVERSRCYRHIIWVAAVSVYSDGRREQTDEVLAAYQQQARLGRRIYGRDYSAVMAMLVSGRREDGEFLHKPCQTTPAFAAGRPL